MAFLKWQKLLVFFSIVGAISTAAAQQDRAKLVQDDRARFLGDEYWIYNDLETGIAKAKDTGRPLLIVFR